MSSKLPRVSKKGYVLAGERAQALLLHGYTGSPYDLRPVADFLAKRDIAVNVPLLKGHGTKPVDLIAATAEDWLSEAQEILEGFDHKKPIIVGGLSMGALIAIILATSHRKIRGLVLFSPALVLNITAQFTILSAKLGMLDKRSSLPKLSGGSDIADSIARKKTPAYLEMPVAGLLQFAALQKLALENIHNIACPVFLAFGQHDSAINTTSSHHAMVSKLTAPLVAKFYHRSKHVITLDYDREQLCDDIGLFLSDMCGISL